MTIDEAIELITWENDPTFICSLKELREAKLLGIEALKRCKLLSKYHPNIDWQPLPGETPSETEASHET